MAYRPNRQADALGWTLVALLVVVAILSGLKEGWY